MTPALDHEHEALVAERLAITRRYLDAAHGGGDTDGDGDAEGDTNADVRLDACAAERRFHERISVALARGAVLPIAWPRRRLALTDTEEQVLWVLIAHELCPDARRRLRALATEELADVSLDVLRRVVYGARADLRAWRELAPGGTLRRACLIERIGDPDAPAHRTTFRVARRVLALAHGDTGLDEELAGLAARAAGSQRLDQLELEPGARDRVRDSLARASALAILHGRPGSGRRSAWLAAAREVGLELLVIDARELARERERAERQLRVAARECRLLGLAPLVLHLDALAAPGAAPERSERPERPERPEQHDHPDRLALLEAELTGLVLATADRPIARRWRRPPIAIELPPLLGAARARLWRRVLPAASAGDAELLATMYPLAPALIHAVGAIAARAAAGAAMEPGHVEAGVRAVLDDRLAGLAARVAVTQTWDDLVLPDDQTTALVELLARVRQRRRVHEDWGFAEKLGRGLGVVALFSGPPGTGKTMCAGLIARELGTELYQVDPSRIAPPWIGETEKNLAALFEAAEAGHAMLWFDEADAVFGRRTAVRTSNDRHANQETSCLLQRLERFTGTCILTTNREGAIDEALRRRISIHVRFAMPDADERERLWRAMLPARAPVAAELGLGELARRYAMSGGHIRNAVLRAAFLAADEDGPITAELLAHAAQLEHEAMGKIASGERLAAWR
jgi:predicted nucleic acid-binding protein